MAKTQKCAHPSCTCMTTEKYCSAYCEGQQGRTEIACQCGHSNCQGEIE